MSNAQSSSADADAEDETALLLLLLGGGPLFLVIVLATLMAVLAVAETDGDFQLRVDCLDDVMLPHSPPPKTAVRFETVAKEDLIAVAGFGCRGDALLMAVNADERIRGVFGLLSVEEEAEEAAFVVVVAPETAC